MRHIHGDTSARPRHLDTVYALSTHPGRSAIAVIRISGSLTREIAQKMLSKDPEPRQARFSRILDPHDNQRILDHGLSVYFAGPRSYTGEDMLELHTHGGTAVVTSVLSALGGLEGVRMADAGEFSRRAFDNGKLGLTELEGVADLVAAETEEQRLLALRQAGGELQRMYESWRQALVRMRAEVEAFVDFAEDENIEDEVYPRVRQAAERMAEQLQAHLDDGRRGEVLRSGLRLAIVGPPNAGKSSLLNRLAGRAVAIVSPQAGTTRDVVESTLDIGGYPVVVGDSAGIRRDAADEVEQEGVRRALDAAWAADLRLCVVDAAQAAQGHMAVPAGLAEVLRQPQTLLVLNKADLLQGTGSSDGAEMQGRIRAWAERQGAQAHVLVSCATGAGWSELVERLAADIRGRWGHAADSTMPLTKARHREHLHACLQSLQRAQAVGEAGDPVLVAEELRRACEALGRITGHAGLEDVLDALFSHFCIGK
ncbi:tRNA modification GTPase gtpbp3, mitochondrial [Coemansia sp. Benny D115]|nr:tRNA modification GTPase gtpbp3, mitochondrial [Coemansia sp. Benny D115]